MGHKKSFGLRLKKMIPGYAFAAPGILFAAIYMGYPLIRSFYLSFTKYNFAFDKNPVFWGLSNFTKMFSDAYFMDSLRNTAVFSSLFFPSLMIFSLIIAMLLDKGVRGSGVFRTCIFLSMVVPLSLTGIIFQWILNNQYGLLNTVLREVFKLDFLAHNWLGEGKWAMVSIVVVSLWKNMGMLVIFFIAGLAAIPGDIIESAKIDGANAYQRIFLIILPNLKESYVICGLWAIIQSVKVFEQPFVMTNGGPGTATLVLYQYTWMNAFKYYEMGYASAIAYFMGVIILLLSALNMYLNRDKDVDEVKGKRSKKREVKA
ncbi:carbohydrate ABC transporter permease [Lacrimispora celerecrescens]|uniref:Multiple sugar transport system permease protein/raffinose/stachyose/melibiose transport system permease protein n=1 Tax=[Clostridium] celerecrescens 18A TaxID=1286362 RepID=A0A2M8ZAE7_9FIRM|nr:sugar ABC transporter permease [Lacrimispora celerecrescens]PJJ30417.1 multiple sugar transport system permease protein/raffinose/stachyose/melibiose transport system permease protein [[Clostridium] celerecrescens 18A]